MGNPHALPDGVSYGTTCKQTAQAVADRFGLKCSLYEHGGFNTRGVWRWGVTPLVGGGFHLIRDFELPLIAQPFTGRVCGLEVIAGVQQ